MSERPGLSRRAFLTGGLRSRIAALLGSAVLAAPVEATGADVSVSARDLTRMGRDEVRHALSRIRARWRTR